MLASGLLRCDLLRGKGREAIAHLRAGIECVGEIVRDRSRGPASMSILSSQFPLRSRSADSASRKHSMQPLGNTDPVHTWGAEPAAGLDELEPMAGDSSSIGVGRDWWVGWQAGSF